MTKSAGVDTPKEIMIRKMPGRLCLFLLLLAGAANGMAQQRDQNNDPRRGQAQEQAYPSNQRGQQGQDGERGARDNRGQADGGRQGRLSPEERQALRRQIDEAGHDIYRPRR